MKGTQLALSFQSRQSDDPTATWTSHPPLEDPRAVKAFKPLICAGAFGASPSALGNTKEREAIAGVFTAHGIKWSGPSPQYQWGHGPASCKLSAGREYRVIDSDHTVDARPRGSDDDAWRRFAVPAGHAALVARLIAAGDNGVKIFAEMGPLATVTADLAANGISAHTFANFAAGHVGAASHLRLDPAFEWRRPPPFSALTIAEIEPPKVEELAVRVRRKDSREVRCTNLYFTGATIHVMRSLITADGRPCLKKDLPQGAQVLLMRSCVSHVATDETLALDPDLIFEIVSDSEQVVA
jgi:hypothetical protein